MNEDYSLGYEDGFKAGQEDMEKQEKALAQPEQEHDLQDTRCKCCGYMTYHREHMGCIRAAKLGQEPVAKAMTAHRAAYFMERFKHEEKLLGPNEQAALNFVISMLEAQPERGPVAEIVNHGGYAHVDWKAGVKHPVGTKFYTTPPQRTWVGLTDEESVEMMRQVPHLTIGGLLSVEAKLKEKNT